MSSTTETKKYFPWFDDSSGRWTIDGQDVHCGDCFQVRRHQYPAEPTQWYDVRAEYAHDCGGYWYLIGLPNGWNMRCWDIYEARRYQ